MRVSPYQWIHHEVAPKHLHATHCRYTWTTSVTQKGFSHFTHTTVLTHAHHQRFPSHIKVLSIIIHDIRLRVLFRKETPASPQRAAGTKPKHSTSRHHSRHCIINAGEIGLNMVGI